MSNKLEQGVQELLDRTRRLETRMVQLGDHVGANLRSKQKIEIRRPDRADAGNAYVVIDSLDVSVSRILTELQQHDVPLQNVPVLLGGKTVFVLNPLE